MSDESGENRGRSVTASCSKPRASPLRCTSRATSSARPRSTINVQTSRSRSSRAAARSPTSKARRSSSMLMQRVAERCIRVVEGVHAGHARGAATSCSRRCRRQVILTEDRVVCVAGEQVRVGAQHVCARCPSEVRLLPVPRSSGLRRGRTSPCFAGGRARGSHLRTSAAPHHSV